MLMKPTLWSRRTFVQGMGYASLGAAGLRGLATGRGNAAPSFAYVGYGGRLGQGIQVFAIRGERWTPTQTIAVEHPSSLALHPNQQFLYAISEIDSYQGLPSGAITAYAVAPDNGHLTLLNRQALSMSATMPRHLAIAPDGRSLVVAIHGGGAYNVLPIGADGHLERVAGILKETGSGPKSKHQDASHPQMLMFDTTG